MREQRLLEISNEVNKCFATPYINIVVGGFDILKWRKSNTKEFPILSQIAKDIFAILTSTVASEQYRVLFVKVPLLKGQKKNLGRKQKIKGENNLVDGISELPDEILSSIVSLLPLKEAAATSILSKRWQYVWASTLTLNFDARLEFGDTLWRFNSMPPELKDLEQHRYVNWIDTVVEQHRGRVIKQFRASFYVDCCFASSIDKWIQFAMNKRVQVLELVFHIESYNRWGDLYTFPHKLLGLENGSTLKLEHMRSDIPSLRSCGYNTGFKLLRVLHFQFVDVTGEVLEYFLSNCPVLERLTVHSAFTNLVNLRVIGPSVALKYLDIKFCPYLQTIEICDANLLSLDYEGSAINMLVSNVPLLVEVSISMSLDFAVDGDDGEIYFKSVEVPFTQLSCCLSQLEVLKLDTEGAMYNRNHLFPVLTNLKHLELRVKADDRWAPCRLTSFMKASPFLQRLVLKMCFRAPSEFDSGLGGGRKKKGEVLRPPPL
nr:putative F-box/FBD/LRR-repeat protein At4g13965 [Malus domestica]